MTQMNELGFYTLAGPGPLVGGRWDTRPPPAPVVSPLASARAAANVESTAGSVSGKRCGRGMCGR